MLSQLLASSYAPPVPPTTYVESREDEQAPTFEPNPEILVEVVDCKDIMTNGTFAWVGTCNMRPMYRLLGPEPRYLYYAEADIASGWRIVDKMGSEQCVERFSKPIDAQLPINCETGDFGGYAIEGRLTGDILHRICMVSSPEEKIAIREKLFELYGSELANLEAAQRGFISRASPVVAIAHALEAQQRAIQLLHSHLSAETQRREAAEQHAFTMEEAFETLQLRIQAQLPGPPNVGNLKELQATIGSQQSRSLQSTMLALEGPQGGGKLAEPFPQTPDGTHDRAIVFEKDGKADWAPDIGAGCGPVHRQPISPKERKPADAPTFRKVSSGLRLGGTGGTPKAPPEVGALPERTAPTLAEPAAGNLVDGVRLEAAPAA